MLADDLTAAEWVLLMDAAEESAAQRALKSTRLGFHILVIARRRWLILLANQQRPRPPPTA